MLLNATRSSGETRTTHTLALYYIFPDCFYTRKEDSELASRIHKGLLAAKADGSYEQLLFGFELDPQGKGIGGGGSLAAQLILTPPPKQMMWVVLMLCSQLRLTRDA